MPKASSLPDVVELAIYPPMTNTLKLETAQPQGNDIVLLQIGSNTTRQQVVQRDDDLLTPAQIKENWSEVRQAMLKELQT